MSQDIIWHYASNQYTVAQISHKFQYQINKKNISAECVKIYSYSQQESLADAKVGTRQQCIQFAR